MDYQKQLMDLLDQCQRTWVQLQSNKDSSAANSRKDLRDAIKQLVQLQDDFDEIHTEDGILLWEKQAQALLHRVPRQVGSIINCNTDNKQVATSQVDNKSTPIASIDLNEEVGNNRTGMTTQPPVTTHQNDRDLSSLDPASFSSNIPKEQPTGPSVFSSPFSQSRFTARPTPSASTPWSSTALNEEQVVREFQTLSVDSSYSSTSPSKDGSVLTTANTIGPGKLVKSNSSLSMYSLPSNVIDAPSPHHTSMGFSRPMGQHSFTTEELPDIRNETRSKQSLSLPFKKLNSSYSSPVPGALAQINFYKDDSDGNGIKSFASDAIVDHPLRIGVGYGSYICYSCTVFIHKGTPITTRKRYSDFVNIRQQLMKLYPNMMSIPKLPPKKIVKKFDPVFIEQRRRDLEYFFKYIVLHPTLGSSTAVKEWIAP
ncbi:hypothetical protein BCR42DRAFT_427034 [Absidia repens]|uniref:Endosomal/vacuolar adapter protein YPT35 n=1 Tax=Absidia repens TaxID=90262 RepID=A0A1X2I0J7_9FUNG|nr:hypothetical protein BCR42DRAFT_427034 [Absidia repens]